MRSVFDPLLIALGLLLVAGCALPDRTISRSDDFGYRSKDAAVPNATEDGRLSFKPPRRLRPAESPPTEVADLNESDLTDRNSDPDLTSKSDRNENQEIMSGYSSDLIGTSVAAGNNQKNRDSIDASRQSVPSTAGGTGRPRTVRQAVEQRDANEIENAIQLQGLESVDGPSTDAPPAARNSRSNSVSAAALKPPMGRSLTGRPDSQVPLWSDRLDARNNPSARMESRQNSNGVNSIKQATHSGMPLIPSLSNPQNLLPPLPWQNELEQLIARVEQNLSNAKPDSQSEPQTEYLRKQAHLRMLYLMAQRQEEALAAIPGVEASQQEYWQQMLWAMSNSLDSVQFPDPNERAAQTVRPLTAALRQMREEAPLSIKNMTFCRKISYFGNYERFPRNEFTPGNEALLYTEIENFVSTPTVEGEYRTSLKSLIEILDSSGKVVWTKGFPSTEDFCRNPRRDYFHNYQFHFPQDLPTGSYSLKLTIVDELSHKRVSNSLNFVLK